MPPALGSPRPDAAVNARPPSAANAPEYAYASTRDRLTLTPARYAAPRFDPVAYSARPGRVRRTVSQRTANDPNRISSAVGNHWVSTVSTETSPWKRTGAPPPGTWSTASA